MLSCQSGLWRRRSHKQRDRGDLIQSLNLEKTRPRVRKKNLDGESERKSVPGKIKIYVHRGQKPTAGLAVK